MQHNVRGNPYVKNYEFDFNFGPVWGQCSVTMTSVLGHLTGTEYSPEHRKWSSCAPVQLFELPIYQTFDDVGDCITVIDWKHSYMT